VREHEEDDDLGACTGTLYVEKCDLGGVADLTFVHDGYQITVAEHVMGTALKALYDAGPTRFDIDPTVDAEVAIQLDAAGRGLDLLQPGEANDLSEVMTRLYNGGRPGKVDSQAWTTLIAQTRAVLAADAVTDPLSQRALTLLDLATIYPLDRQTVVRELGNAAHRAHRHPS